MVVSINMYACCDAPNGRDKLPQFTSIWGWVVFYFNAVVIHIQPHYSRVHQINAGWLESTWKTYIYKLKSLKSPSKSLSSYGSFGIQIVHPIRRRFYDKVTKAVFYNTNHVLLKSSDPWKAVSCWNTFGVKDKCRIWSQAWSCSASRSLQPCLKSDISSRNDSVGHEKLLSGQTSRWWQALPSASPQPPITADA